MKKKHLLYLLAILIFCWLILKACSSPNELTKQQIITVKTEQPTNTLYFSGIIQPLKTLVVPSPTDGVVIDVLFQYGDMVKAGQRLFLIASTKFLTDYKSALMQYIKAKNDFNTSQMQLSEAAFLHKHELISDDDYKTKQASYYAAQLALAQAKDALENLLFQLNIKNIDLYKLTIADVDKITQALHLQKDSENLIILSPATGFILAANKNDDETKKIAKGEVVKQGDALAMIGDLDGLSVHIKVNELTINQLHLGQKIKVTGVAFPEDTLIGEISRIDKQGETTNGGLPVFPVTVVIPHLTEQQKKIIHIGMSAKVEVNIDEAMQIMVPVEAVFEKDGQFYVEFYDETTGKTKEIIVNTGKTTTDKVVILSGLKVGDKIVVAHPAR